MFDLIPHRFLADFCEVKNNITKHVLENYPKPSRYDYMLKVCEMLEDIENQPLSLNRLRLEDIRNKEDNLEKDNERERLFNKSETQNLKNRKMK